MDRGAMELQEADTTERLTLFTYYCINVRYIITLIKSKNTRL